MSKNATLDELIKKTRLALRHFGQHSTEYRRLSAKLKPFFDERVAAIVAQKKSLAPTILAEYPQLTPAERKMFAEKVSEARAKHPEFENDVIDF